jgi:hypothetical protein
MASYTDIIPQFTPYVSETPVQALVEVGMEKQRRYDEGIQKIQTYVDNVAGLPVARPIDKAYLQSKLNELGGKLKTVAAGDFSNFQLVNSVSGMANQIIKDPTVQNAVSSAARYQKELANLQAARAKGESSPSNEWVFNNAASQWMNSDNPNTSFDGYYQPYTNWKKNALEVVKALTKDETITDDAFTVDASGKLVIADAIVRKKMSGVSADKIQNALLNGLSPADFKQMQIDALYNYSNQDSEKFRNTINTTYGGRVKSFADQITMLENAKSSTTSAEEKDRLNQQILSLNKVVNSITKEQGNLLGIIDSGNLEGAKAQFGTHNAISGLADSLSYSQISQTYETSPFAEMNIKREQIRNQVQQFWAKYNQDQRQFDANQALEKWKVEIQQAKDKGYGGVLSGMDLANILGVKESEVGPYLLAQAARDAEGGQQQVNQLKQSFLRMKGKDEKWLAQQKTAWERNPNGVDPTVGSYFNQVAAIERQALSNEMLLANLDSDADRLFGTVDQYVPKNAPNLIFTTKSGRRETYTPKDFVDFNNMVNRYVVNIPGGGTVPSTGKVMYDDARAKSELSPKMYQLYEVYKSGARNTGGNKTLYDNLVNYRKTVNQPYQKVIRERNDWMANEIKNRMTVNQAGMYNIPSTSAAQKESLGNILTSFISLAERPGGIANSPGWDSEVASALRLDKDAQWSIRVSEGTTLTPESYEVTVSGKAGTVKFNMTPDQKRRAFANEFESTPATQMVLPYIEQMNRMGGFTTSFEPGAESNWNNSYLNAIDFPSVKSYGVKANLEQPFGQPGSYSIRLSISDPITGKIHNDIPFPRTGSIPQNKLAEALINLSDAGVYELINGKPATANDLKRVQQATKKPF